MGESNEAILQRQLAAMNYVENGVLVVRWMDAMLERLECKEIRYSATLVWARLKEPDPVTGETRFIPTIGNVRWYSIIHGEQHEQVV